MDHLERPQRKLHPRERCHLISNIFFLFAWPIYKKGFKKDLEEDDIYEVIDNLKSKTVGDRLENKWENQKKRKKDLSIMRLLWATYGPFYIFLGIIQLIYNLGEILIQPWALGKLISYFTPGQTNLTKTEAYYYAALVIGFNFLLCMVKHNYFLACARFGIEIRTAFCSFIYRKALKLSPTKLGDISIGKIVTLITRDVQVFEGFVDFANDVWISILKFIIIGIVLYMKIGLASLAGVAFFIIIIPLQIYLGSRVTNLKTDMCRRTDDRLQITQETLSAIKIIKMYNWEQIFDKKINYSRIKEIRCTFLLYLIRYSVLVIGDLNAQTAFYILITAYLWLENYITAEIVYYLVALFKTLSFSMSALFPMGIYNIAALMAAKKRIGNVVKALEVEPEEEMVEISIVPKIALKNVTMSIKDKKILQEIDMKVENGLTIITGPVGSGKSFLLKTILQDYMPEEGSVIVKGSVSYASQEPWLFPSSIRQNILFGGKYDEKRYNEVLNVCALIYDFDLLEHGDDTIVEDRGINLSKGQQARVNLARAVYKESDIYLLDDCLSALDAHVSSFIFYECIKKFLKNKLVVLVTHSTKFLKDADDVMIMENGSIKLSGKLEEINEKLTTDLNVNEEDSQDPQIEDHFLHLDSTNEETKLINETSLQRKVYQEAKKIGSVDAKVYNKYIQFGGGYFAFFIVVCLFAVSQFSSSLTDKLISKWVNLEQDMSILMKTNNTNGTYQELQLKRTSLLQLYSFMTIGTAISQFVRVAALFLFCRVASQTLHQKMIHSIIHASMRFFDTNFIGNILNRFSKDLSTIDEMIPFVLYHLVRMILVLTGIVTLIATVNTFFLLPTGLFLAILLTLRMFSVRTGRSLKRLDAITRSPVIGHINAILEGLTTIRAFKAQKILQDEYDRHQDLYTSTSYIVVSSMRAFAYTLDSLCGIYIAVIVLRCLIFEDISAGEAGLAVSQAFMLTGSLQWGVRQWAEIENQMTSVERALEYTEIVQETTRGQDLNDWPKRGEIQYKNVYLTYTNSKEYVLKNINFVIKSTENIGIVGRTGAGKSSIISTLFRLYEVEGQILIDDVDTRTITLECLRSRISIIPQDPVLFTGTIRENIDPTSKYSDEEIWRAIDASNLKPYISSLDIQITESGAHFSVGQRQLICLARTVVRNNKIIILDEATANMDQETDTLLHETIKKNFSHCTLIIIAHKLQSILNCDKVIVMDKGEVVEYGHPKELLKIRSGMFYKMIEKSGLL